jgi:hypothetical protein
MTGTNPFSPQVVEIVKSSHQQTVAVRANYSTWTAPITLDVISASISWDENRAPRVQAEITVAVPDSATINLLDPRLGIRIEIDAGYAAGAFSESHNIANLGLRDRSVSRPDNTMTLRAASDEALVIDAAPGAQKSTIQSSLPSAISKLIKEVTGNATVTVTTTQGQEALVLEAISDRWGTISDLSDRMGTEVFDAGLRTFYVQDRPLLAVTEDLLLEDGVNGTLITSEVGQSRDDWANKVQLKYQWTDEDDVQQTVFGFAQQSSGPFRVQGPAGIRTYTENRNVPSGGSACSASARSLLQRFMSRSKKVSVEAISALWLRPGETVRIKSAELNDLFLVSSVSFDLVSGTMSVTTRQPSSAGVKKTLSWSGYTWDVRETQDTHGPGPNAWSDSAATAFVDGSGYMNLKISQEGGLWRCVELEGPHLGYGKYTWVVDTDPTSWQIQPVLGLFTYDDTDDGTAHWREIDIEFSKWNFAPEPSRSWFSVQPIQTPAGTTSGGSPAINYFEQRISDHAVNANIPYTCSFTWQKGQVYFRVTDSLGNLIGENLVNDAVPVPDNETIRMNLWLIGGQPPADANPVIVKIRSFAFEPIRASLLRSRVPAANTVMDFSIANGFQVATKVGTVPEGSPNSSITGGKLQLNCTKPTYSAAYTGTVFDLNSSHVTIRVDEMPVDGNYTTEAVWQMRYNDQNLLQLFYSGGGFYARRILNGVAGSSTFIPGFDLATFKYWRISESNGVATFSYAATYAGTYTTGATISHGMTTQQISMMRSYFQCGYFGTETAPGSWKIGTVNKA